MSKVFTYIDGKYAWLPSAVAEALAPGKINAQGVFETIRVFEGRVEFFNDHIRRFMAGLTLLKIKHAFKEKSIAHVVRTILKEDPSKARLSRLRIMAWQEGKAVHLLCAAFNYHPPTKKMYAEGLKTVLVKTNIKANARLSQVKSLRRDVYAQADAVAKAKGYDEAILLNDKGHIVESTRANVFIARQGKIITPPLSSGCLDGIMRKVTIEKAKDLGFVVVEQTITPAMWQNADHAFLTNSMMGIIPIHPCPSGDVPL